jgi:protein-S-isoprenylcysteine O-methyltransferase Ste14
VFEMFATRLARMRVPLGFFCAGAVLWLARPTLQSLVIGSAIAACGEIVRIWAAGHLEKGQEVTQSGPYRITRHPLYVGSAIIALGAAVASARVSAMVVIAVYMAATLASAVRHEEGAMRAAFGDEYDAYVQSRAKPIARPFSFARAIKNKEHKSIAGLAAVGALFAVKAFFFN